MLKKDCYASRRTSFNKYTGFGRPIHGEKMEFASVYIISLSVTSRKMVMP
jgi:hypothetical protein